MDFLYLFLLSLVTNIRAEIFKPDSISLSDTEEMKHDDASGDNADPFNSSSLNENDNPDSESNATEHLSEHWSEHKALSNFSENKPQTNLKSEIDKPIVENNLFGFNKDKKEKEPQVLKPGEKPKPGVSYWTTAFVDKEMKSVLVNVKTVTIIESVISSKQDDSKTSTKSSSNTNSETNAKNASSTKSSSNTNSETSTKNASSTDPYIKIQMPSKKIGTDTKTKDKSNDTTSSTSKQSSKSKQPLSTYKKNISKGIKSLGSKMESKTLSTSIGNKQQSDKITTTSAGKEDAFAKKSTSSTASASSTSTKDAKHKDLNNKKESNDGKSLSSIFNVLKGMPSGGKKSESLYVEGLFKFPKKKEVNNKVFKMSGYISTK